MTKVSTWLLVLVVCGVSACSRRTPQEYIASGDRYMAEHKYKEAGVEYGNAVSREPKNGPAHMRLAEAYLADGNRKRAFPEFIQAADLMPDNDEAQLRAGHNLLLGAMYTESKARARVVLQRDPSNVNALLLLANSLAGSSLEDATNVLQRALAIDPERAGLYTNLGIFELAQGDPEQAEITFQKAVTVSHGSPAAYVGLGNFYLAVKRLPEAEKALKQAVDAGPQNLGALRALASFYMSTDRLPLAEPLLQTVTTLANDAGARYALANYYTTAGRPAESIKILEQLALDAKEFSRAKRTIALVQFYGGDRVAARATVDELLAKNPKDGEGLTLKARLLLANHEADAALEAARAAIAANYQLAAAHLTLGRIHLAQGNRDEARKAFSEVISIDPDSLPATLELAELYRTKRELDTALRFAEDAIKAYPQSLPARLARLKILLMRSDDLPRAGDDARGLLAKYPKSAEVHIVVASYFMGTRNAASARQEFQKALELNPASVEALSGLVTLEIVAKNVSGARARVEAQLVKAPASLPLLLLAAKVQYVDGDRAKAEATLRRAIAADPSDPQAYGLLADMYVRQGRIEEAQKEFTQLAKLDPLWAGAPTMLGTLAYQQHNNDEARKWWEKAIALGKGSAAAANNLAWLLAESNTELDHALELALSARAKMPDSAEINDTLGWIYYKKKIPNAAIQYLLNCTDAEPKNVGCQFHIGMAYALAGEDAKAGRALKAALAIDPKFPGADLAKRTLLTLVY